MQPERSNRPLLTAPGRRLLERRIAELGRVVEVLRTSIYDPESRTEYVGEYLRTLREMDRLRAVLREAASVDDADPITVTIEGNTKIAVLARARLLQLNELLRDRRIGMMRRKGAVDRFVQQDMPAG